LRVPRLGRRTMPVSSANFRGAWFLDPIALRLLFAVLCCVIGFGVGAPALLSWLAGAVVVLLLLIPFFVPVIVNEHGLRFWGRFGFRVIDQDDVLMSVHYPIVSKGTVAPLVLVAIDASTGKSWNLWSVMTANSDEMFSRFLTPIADKLDQRSVTVLPWVLLADGLNGPLPYSMSIGATPKSGDELSLSARKGLFGYRLGTSDWRVDSVSHVNHPNERMLRLDLSGKSPGLKHGLVLFQSKTTRTQ
jgi:hypothetical protein